jgi:leucyl aminopeptidase
LETAVAQGLAIAEGVALTKDLGNLGGNVCNPAYMAETAQALAKEFGFEVEVLEREDMATLGMGSALSVGRASYSPCKFIVMNYRGGGTAKPIVLVGKGMTFDSGGISLKPGAGMDEMKYDMCGGGLDHRRLVPQSLRQ